MKRTTTPTHTFTFTDGFDPTTLTALNITYLQKLPQCGCTAYDKTEVVLVKHLGDCILDDHSVSITLTQEETNQFIGGEKMNIQLHGLVGDKSYQSNIITTICREVLNDEVLE